MKSMLIKLLIAIPLIYLALFTGLWSSVTDSRPILSLLDMMRSDSATEILIFHLMKKNRPNQNLNLIKIEIPIMAIFTFTPSILLMLIYSVLQQHLTTVSYTHLTLPTN